MALTTERVSPSKAVPIFARLYGVSPSDFEAAASQLTGAWLLRDGNAVLGALGTRPSPAHGSEVLGGALPGERQRAAALALVRALVASAPHFYAYGEPDRLPAEVLSEAGLEEVASYTRLVGDLPALENVALPGFRIVPLAEVHDVDVRLAVQLTYADRIGHTFTTPESVAPNAGGSDDTIGHVAFDAEERPCGVCRAWLEGDVVTLGTPGVRRDARFTSLRRALLSSVFEAARAVGARRVVLEGWGDTFEEQAHDEALGFMVDVRTPIFAAGHR